MPERKVDSYQVSLKLILKNKEGKTLILKALDNGVYAGHYDLPGGRIDTDEFGVDFVEIIKREAKEELGGVKIKVKLRPVALGRHLHRSLSQEGRRVPIILVFFEGEFLGGEISISHEHTSYEWVKLDEINLTTYFTSSILEGVQMYLGQKSSDA